MTSLTAPAAPRTRAEWNLWANYQVEALGLCHGEASLLRVLVARCDGAGRVKLGVRLIARQVGLSEARTYHWLRALSDRRLLVTRHAGAGRVAVRELVADPVTQQLALFDDGFRASWKPVSAPPPQTSRQTSRDQDRPLASENQTSRQREAAVKGAIELLPPLPPASGGSETPVVSDDVMAPARPRGDRRRHRDAFAAEMQAWGAVHFPGAVAPGAVGAAVSWLQARSSRPVTVGDLRRLAACNAIWAYQLGLPAESAAVGARS